MNDTLAALFFGAGIATVAYTKLGRRVGYGNEKNVWTIVAVAFVLSFIIFYTILAVVLGIH